MPTPISNEGSPQLGVLAEWSWLGWSVWDGVNGSSGDSEVLREIGAPTKSPSVLPRTHLGTHGARDEYQTAGNMRLQCRCCPGDPTLTLCAQALIHARSAELPWAMMFACSVGVAVSNRGRHSQWESPRRSWMASRAAGKHPARSRARHLDGWFALWTSAGACDKPGS